MPKKIYFRLLAIVFAIVLMAGCVEPVPDPSPEPGPEPGPEPVVLKDFKTNVPVTGNWVFDTRPDLTVEIENLNDVAVSAEIKVKISTDLKQEVTTVIKTEEIAAKSKQSVQVTTESDLAPGFYRASCYVNGKTARNFMFGISPTKIVSAPDKQDDFDTFWEAAKAQLEDIDMNPQLTEISSRSRAGQKVYLVELQSVPDGLTGEPVTVRGYYLEPQGGKKYPVLMHYYGYDDTPPGKLDCPYGSDSPKYAEFYLSTRGQKINCRTAKLRSDGIDRDFSNTYGDWFAFNFGVRDGYYYRGAFLDCVQAIRFMATRESSDMDNLFAEGSSQGGAFTYAAAALSDYPFAAVAPCVAFLGDFPDYFNIVSWPGNTAKANKGSMTNEEMYAFLSYFDTKNLATRITCPVIACSCLQDGTCPPHTNVAPFNNLNVTDKEIYFYPLLQHEIPGDWPGKWSAFFKAHTK